MPAAQTARVSSAATVPVRRSLLSRKEALRGFLDGVGAAEVVVASLLAAALWLPPLVGERAWTPALALLALLAGYTIVRNRRLPPLPVIMFVYLAAYAPAMVHGGTFHVSELKQGYFIRPLTALAVAAVVTNPLQRLRALVLIVLFAASQVPITAVQAIENLVRYGRNSVTVNAEDSVTGLLGSGQGSTVTLAALAAATIVIAAWLWGALGSITAVVTSVGLVAVGAFTSTRATGGFVAIVGGAIVVAALAPRGPHPPLRRLLAVSVASVVAAAGVYGLTRAIYKDVFSSVLSTQELGVSVLSTQELGVCGGVGCAVPRRIPGRFVQLKLAVRLSVRDGAVVAALGRGPGSSDAGNDARPLPLPKRTGTSWFGKILTETGWLGVTAFFGFLAWLVLLGWRLSRRRDAATVDRVLGAALPGIAALTLGGAAYMTILTTRGYATLFWLLVGIAISADYDGRPRPRLEWERATR